MNYRSLLISDVHLGTKHSQVGKLLVTGSSETIVFRRAEGCTRARPCQSSSGRAGTQSDRFYQAGANSANRREERRADPGERCCRGWRAE